MWEQRKESLAELEKTKEEMEEAKRMQKKSEEQTRMTIEGETGNRDTTPEAISKQSQDDLDLFRALAEKLGETFESVGDNFLVLYPAPHPIVHLGDCSNCNQLI